MMDLSKYIGLYILENKDELEELLDKIDLLKESMPFYDWLEEVSATQIIETFYNYQKNSIMDVDSILHFTHLHDSTLREKTYIFVGYYKNVKINFFTGLMTLPGNEENINLVKNILKENKINFEKLDIYITSGFNYEENENPHENEAIYISFLSIEEEIDRNNIHKLYEIFPNGYVEE